MIGCKDAVIPMPVLARRRHEIGESVEKLKRREFYDVARAGPAHADFRLRPGPTQLAALCRGSTEGTPVMRPSEPRMTDSRSSANAIPQQTFQTLRVALHVPIDEHDSHARIDGKLAVLPGDHVGGDGGGWLSLNQRITRRRTRSVSAARSAGAIGPAGRNAGGPSPFGTRTPLVAHACRCTW